MMLRVFGALAALLLANVAIASEPTLDTARAQFDAMHTDEALSQFSGLQAQKPNDPVVLYYLGRLQLRKYHREAAVQLLRQAVALQPSNVEYKISLCEAIGAYIDDVPFYRKLGLAEEIHKHLEEGLIADPRSLEVHDGLMKFYLSAPILIGGSHDKALLQAAQIAALYPSRGHVAYGVISRHDKHYADAEREFRAAIQMTPNDPLPRYELGATQQMQKHYNAAFSTYAEILHDLPQETAPYYYLADTAAISGQRLDSGLDAIKIYLSRGPLSDDDPAPVLAYRVLGHLSELGARLDAARSAYLMALQMDPANAEVAAALRKLD